MSTPILAKPDLRAILLAAVSDNLRHAARNEARDDDH